MIVTTLTLNCTYKHRISGRVYPLVLLEIASMISWPEGNISISHLLILSNQSCIFIFMLKCRIQLIRPVCLVFLFKIVLSIHGFCSGRTIFPCSHRVQDPIPTPTWCGHRSNYQIMSIFVFLLSVISISLLSKDFVLFS